MKSTFDPTNSTVLPAYHRFGDIYADLLETLLAGPADYVSTEVNERTGSEIRALVGGTSFKLDLSDNRMPIPSYRRFHAKTVAAEVAWFLKGDKDVTWLRKYAPIWDKFVEDDGKTIDAAYGYRWMHQFGRNQLHDAMEALYQNPTDRRVFISNWDPAEDGLGRSGQKNVPCPIGFTLSVIDQQLHSTLLIRSSDVFVGLPYDVAGHALLMDTIAASINGITGLGTMTVTLAHPHLYKTHYEMARQSVASNPLDHNLDAPDMPHWQVWEILEAPNRFVEEMEENAKERTFHPFNPRPEIVE